MNKEFILEKLNEYAKLSSLSGQETEFLEHLLKDFQKVVPNKHALRKVYFENELQYALFFTHSAMKRKQSVSVNNVLFVVHVDRVSVEYKPVVEIEADQIQGQLDNLISIVTLLDVLQEVKLAVSILFTTREEIVHSSWELDEVLSLYNFKHVVAVDIEIYRNTEDISSMAIRTKDDIFMYNAVTCEYLHNQAKEAGIPFTVNEIGRTMSEAGFYGQYTRGQKLASALGIPIFNYHSNREIAKWSAIESVSKLTTQLITKQ